MIISKLQGGLGNQMFQYAAGYALARRHGAALKLDTAFLLDRTPRPNFVFRDYCLDLFLLTAEFAAPEERLDFGSRRRLGRAWHEMMYRCGLIKQCYLRESPYRFDIRLFSAPRDTYLEGFWQSADYFADCANELRQQFAFAAPLSDEAAALAETIDRSESVCVNVRRADFVQNAVASAHHGVCSDAYFHAAASEFSRALSQPRFFVFSDDLEWCRGNLRLPNATFVEHSMAGDRFGQYLHLMSLCKYFIIPNSSFGWWAAWLSRFPAKKVIAPKRWYANPRMDTSHLLPKGWTVL